MFHLLKGTNDRSITGDVIVVKNEIESIALIRAITLKETFFKMLIGMKSGEEWIACFNTVEEGKDEMKRLGVPNDIISDYVCQICDQEKEKKEALEEFLRKSEY